MKQEARQVDRREFTRESLLALLAGVTVTVSGCGGGGGGSSPSVGPAAPSAPSPTPTGNTAGDNDVPGSISANHGHHAVVTGAQLAAGGAVRLDIHGEADHTHLVDLTVAEVARIHDGQMVSKDSSATDAHAHTVTFLKGTVPDDSGRY